MAESASGGAILEPDCEVDGFTPKALGQGTMVEDGPNPFEEAAIEGLCHTVVLRGVVRGEPTFRALLLEEPGEVFPSLLTATVRAEALDAGAMLRLSP